MDDLDARGLIHDSTDRTALTARLVEGPTGIYYGIDPTGDSLHVGNLIGLLVLRRFQDAGHRPIALVGGATGMVGDPSGRSDERSLLDDETLAANVAAIRRELDAHGFQDVAILSYAAKFASAFYGPFRDAAQSAPEFGDRRGYQMDPPNRREALREMRLDLEEGADMLMVKPALSYLDILADARREFDVPLAAYHVSGEYSMIKAAGERGWIDADRAMEEALVSIKRAGADLILSYAAADIAERL